MKLHQIFSNERTKSERYVYLTFITRRDRDFFLFVGVLLVSYPHDRRAAVSNCIESTISVEPTVRL